MHLLHFAVHGRLNVNVALNRPSFMSSVLNDPLFGLFYKEKANDGNNDPTAHQIPNSCIHTLTQENAWWAVDLGVALAVIGVLFTNRADDHGNVFRLCTLSVSMLKNELLNSGYILNKTKIKLKQTNFISVLFQTWLHVK